MGELPDLLERFERQLIAAETFHHEDHLRVAYAMLARYDFVDACARYAATIRAMAARVGAADKYNVTITLAFMSLVAERRFLAPERDFDAFLAANPDLLDRNVLSAWYSGGRLTSPAARAQFLLPDKAAARMA